jgi:hypothetical protein
MAFIGRLGNGPVGLLSRTAFAVGGIALATPGNEVIDMSNLELAIWGAVLVAAGAAGAFVDRGGASPDPALAP